jgi:hypothetical protein
VFVNIASWRSGATFLSKATVAKYGLWFQYWTASRDQGENYASNADSEVMSLTG